MRTTVRLLLLAGLAAVAAAGPARAAGVGALGTAAGGWKISPPDRCVRQVTLNEDWTRYGRLSFSVRADPIPRQPLRLLVSLVAWNGWWYQSAELLSIAGDHAHTVELDLGHLSNDWVPRGHLRAWDGYVRQRVRSVRIAVFSPEPYEGRLHIEDVTLGPGDGNGEPFLYDAAVVTDAPAAGEPATVSFRLSRVYPNPFEQGLVSVSLVAGGRRATVPAYFYQAYREADRGRLTPVGASAWRANLIAPEPGTYRWVVHAAGDDGPVELGAGRLVVGEPSGSTPEIPAPDLTKRTPFVLARRVRPKEPVFLLQTEGKPGWTLQAEAEAERAGLVEAWRVPLEWTDAWGGYQGLARYNLENAWRFDRLLAAAEEAGVELPLALNSEEPFQIAFNKMERELGRGRTFNWFSNPLRSGADPGSGADKGGAEERLERLLVPSEYFANQPVELTSGEKRTVLELFEQQVSYIGARWGSSPTVSRFELWMSMPANRAEAWHEAAGRLLARAPLRGKPVISRHPQAAQLGRRRRIASFERAWGEWKAAHRLSEGTRIKWVTQPASHGAKSLQAEGWFPGEAAVYSEVSESWTGYARLAFDVYVPPDAPNHMRAAVYVRERDWWWYETLLEPMLRPGDWTKLIVDISPDSPIWEARGHGREWDGYVAQRIREMGIRVFGKPQKGEEGKFQEYTGRICIDNVELWPDPKSPRPLRVTDLTPNAKKVGQYEKFELSFKLARVFANPFDPKQADIWGHFISPDGRHVRVPAFFSEGYRRDLVGGVEKLTAVGGSCWKVRFAAAQTGTWTCYLEANGTELKKDDPITFKVVPSDGPGYVRRSRLDRHYFEFSTGEFFYPIGHALRSPSDDRRPYNYRFQLPEGKGTYVYDEYFRRMAQAGENAARIWMCSWWCGLEWNKRWPGFGGIGRYNTQNAWRLDHLVEQAGERGIYIMLDTTNHGQYSVEIDHEWEHNPYNRANGGFLDSAREFFTDKRAKQKYRDRMRYTVARWGYSPHIMSWSLFSEVEFVEEYWRYSKHNRNSFSPHVHKWHAEMARFVKTLDPFDHIVTTHVSHPWRGRDIWRHEELEFVQSNAYSKYPQLGQVDVVGALRRIHYDYLKRYDRPALIAEYGGHWMKNSPRALDAELHAGLWATAMMPYAGNTGFWWWLHVHFTDKYKHYRALANYMAGEDRRGRNLVQSDLVIHSPDDVLRTVGLQNKTSAYVWVYHQRVPRTLKWIPPVSGGTLELPALKDGIYRVEFWDTYRGVKTDTREVQCAEKTLRLELPAVKNDLALKIKLKKAAPASPKPE